MPTAYSGSVACQSWTTLNGGGWVTGTANRERAQSAVTPHGPRWVRRPITRKGADRRRCEDLGGSVWPSRRDASRPVHPVRAVSRVVLQKGESECDRSSCDHSRRGSARGRLRRARPLRLVRSKDTLTRPGNTVIPRKRHISAGGAATVSARGQSRFTSASARSGRLLIRA